MISLESEMVVPGLSGAELTDFLLECDDERYRAWWPGTHLELHVLKHGGGDHLGDVVLMDEYVGSRRVRMSGDVVEAIPGELIVWRLRPGRLRLPVQLTLRLKPLEGGVWLRHTITAGWSGVGGVFDPLWRLYFSRSFAGAMDRHVHTEFPMMRDLLDRTRSEGITTSTAHLEICRDDG